MQTRHDPLTRCDARRDTGKPLPYRSIKEALGRHVVSTGLEKLLQQALYLVVTISCSVGLVRDAKVRTPSASTSARCLDVSGCSPTFAVIQLLRASALPFASTGSKKQRRTSFQSFGHMAVSDICKIPSSPPEPRNGCIKCRGHAVIVRREELDKLQHFNYPGAALHPPWAALEASLFFSARCKLARLLSHSRQQNQAARRKWFCAVGATSWFEWSPS